MKPKCSVDVDETLYDFATPLYHSFVASKVSIPPPDEWECWDYFYPKYMTKDVATEHFNRIHSLQEMYEPYVDAAPFLEALSKKYQVVIASHRELKNRKFLVRWLFRNGLKHKSVHISMDKREIFGDVDLVVDDNPHILDYAVSKKIQAVGLRKPWNENTKGALFNSLTEILGVL